MPYRRSIIYPIDTESKNLTIKFPDGLSISNCENLQNMFETEYLEALQLELTAEALLMVELENI